MRENVTRFSRAQVQANELILNGFQSPATPAPPTFFHEEPPFMMVSRRRSSRISPRVVCPFAMLMPASCVRNEVPSKKAKHHQK
jgi:hypothetical protein